MGIFNPGSAAARLTVQWSQLGVRGKQKVRDLWRQKDLGVFDKELSTVVQRHGVVMVKLKGVAK